MDPNLEMKVDPQHDDAPADELWVHVAAYRDLPAAHLAAGSLEAQGLTPHLTNEFTVGADWLWSAAIGGVGVEVPAFQAAESIEILNDSVFEVADDTSSDLSDLPEELVPVEKGKEEEAAYFRRKQRSKQFRAALTFFAASPDLLLIGLGAWFWTRLRDGSRHRMRGET